LRLNYNTRALFLLHTQIRVVFGRGLVNWLFIRVKEMKMNLLVLVALLTVVAASNEKILNPDGTACRHEDAKSDVSSANILGGLPRLTGFISYSVRSTPNNIGEYTLFKEYCPVKPEEDGSCSEDLALTYAGMDITYEHTDGPDDKGNAIVEFPTNDIQSGEHEADPDNVLNYGEAVGMYVALAAILCVLSILLITGCCWWYLLIRPICCCTRGARLCFCLCKCRTDDHDKLIAAHNKRVLAAAESGRTVSLPKNLKPKSKCWHCCSMCCRIYMLLFVFSVLGFAFMGHLGSESFGPAIKESVDAPAGVVQIARDMVNPLGDLTTNIVGDGFVNLLIDLNITLTDVVDLGVVRESFLCVRHMAENLLPQTGPIYDVMDGADNMINSLPNVTDVHALFDDVNDTMATFDVLIPELKAGLIMVNASLFNGTTQSIDRLMVNFGEMNQTFADLQVFPPSIQAKVDEIDDTMPAIGPVTSLRERTGNLATCGCKHCVPCDGVDPADYRASVKNDMNELKANVSAMPDMTLLADELVEFNDTIKLLPPNVEDSIRLIRLTQGRLSNLEDLSELKGTLREMQNTMDAFNVTSFMPVLLDVRNAATKVPNFDYLIEVVDMITVVQEQSLPCILQLQDQVRNVERELIVLPSMVDELMDTLDDVNSTLTDMKLDDFIEPLKDVNQTLVDLVPQIDDAIDSINDIGSDIDSFQTDLNMTDMIVQLTNVENMVKDLNLTSLEESLQDLLVQLEDPSMYPSMEMVENLRGFNDSTATLPGEIDSGVAAIEQWENGVCIQNPGTNCTDDSVCDTAGGDYCTGSMAVCKNDPSVTCATGCVAPDECALPDLNSMMGDMDELIESMNDRPDMSDFSGELNNLMSNLTSFDMAGEMDSAGDVTSALEDVPAFGDYITELDTVQESVDSTPDMEGMRDQFDDADSMAEDLDVNDQRSMIDQYRDMLDMLPTSDEWDDYEEDYVDKVDRWVYHDLGMYLSRMNKEALQPLFDQRFSLGVERIINTTNDIYAYWMNDTLDVPDSVWESLDIVDVLQDPAIKADGAIYTLMRIAQAANAEPVDLIKDPRKGDRLMYDKDGEEYPDGAMCVTDECLKTEVDEMENSPLKHFAPGVSLSRSAIFHILLALPVLVALLGLCSCAFCCNRLAMFVALIILIVMPWLTLITGVQETMWIVVHDTCASMEDVGRQALLVMSDDSYNFTLPMPKEEIHLNMPAYAAYDNIFGDCSLSGADDPTATVWKALKDGFMPYPRDYADEYLNTTMMDMELRPRMKKPFYRLTTTLGDSIGTLFDDYMGVFSCEVLHDAYFQLKEPLCCNILGAFAWWTTAWWGIGLSFFFCGSWASLWGYTRFKRQKKPQPRQSPADPAAGSLEVELSRMQSNPAAPPLGGGPPAMPVVMPYKEGAGSAVV
jgi:hypothetical protein